MNEQRRRIEGSTPLAQTFEVNGQPELCHPTGYEVMLTGKTKDWYIEFEDSNGEKHYRR